jgi:hypothetical protein
MLYFLLPALMALCSCLSVRRFILVDNQQMRTLAYLTAFHLPAYYILANLLKRRSRGTRLSRSAAILVRFLFFVGAER